MTFESISRRGILGVFAATTVAAAPVMANAFGLIRGAGDVRRIRMRLFLALDMRDITSEGG